MTVKMEALNKFNNKNATLISMAHLIIVWDIWTKLKPLIIFCQILY